MFVELGAMLSLESGQRVYDSLKEDENVFYLFLETGRSNDLFEEKQFGEYGEASILTLVVDEEKQEDIFENIFELAGLSTKNEGVIFRATKLIKCTHLPGTSGNC